MAEARTISILSEELVEAGRRFGKAWAELKQKWKEKQKPKDKWFDNMILKLDSPSMEGFSVILRKMVKEMKEEQGLKWNISTDVLSLLMDKTKTSWRAGFLTGVFFGYFGYFEKGEVKNG